MPDPTTEQRLISLERSIDHLHDSLQQLVRVQEELKDISKHTVELLSNNRFIGTRVEIMERKLESALNCVQDLQVSNGRLDLQISGVWKVIGIVNAVALALFGWFLSKIS